MNLEMQLKRSLKANSFKTSLQANHVEGPTVGA
jgi:hypothetical protein